MRIMRKKYFVMVLAFALLLSLTACGGSDESEEATPDVSEEVSNVLVVGESIEEGDTGTGEVIIESRFGAITIPEGLDYKLYIAPPEEGTATIRVDFGEGNTSSGSVLVSTTRMISSLDDAAKECIRMNDFGTKESVIGDEITYGDLTYKAVTIGDQGSDDISYFLVSHYETDEDLDGYIEINAKGNKDYYYTLDIDNPLVISIMETLMVK